MTRQPYELNHPLYPHRDLLNYFADHKIAYQPYQGAYDDAYKNWYQLVRADHDISGAPKRPISREISQIIRLKSSGKEFIKYSETLWGLDHENNPVPFFHTYGEYNKPAFKKTYNYETNTSHTIRSGQIETVYFLEYDKNLINELYKAGPDNMDIELLVNIGSKQYGGRGFFTYEEFRDKSLEDLARIGRTGKGMFTELVSTVPTGTLNAELRNLSAATTATTAAATTATAQHTQLWKEFQEFQKFKQQEPSSSSSQPTKESKK